MSVRRTPLVLLLAAIVLLSPSLVLGSLISHSSPQNLTWAAQFSDQFRAGIVYPRWLPESFDALGSPTFYFYPPIAFWVTALVSLLSLGALSTSYCLSIASLVLLWTSGMAMHAWLRSSQPTSQSASRVTLVGAIAYMAAPYHLVDHYYRGAFAEFAAFAVLPLVMLAVRRIAEDRRHGVVALAAAYAALPMAHLPTALLISVTVLPLYVLYSGWRHGAPKGALRFFGRCMLAGVLGLGLAAVFLVPALTLQDWIPSETFWAGPYRVENWFLLTPGRWPPPADMMWIIVSCASSYAVAAIGVIVLQAKGSGAAAGWRSEATFWSLACLLCVLLVAGAVPWFWQLPFVAKVQFPWRLMTVVEFAAVTALCLAPWSALRRASAFVLRFALLALVPAIGILLAGVSHRISVSLVEPDPAADLKQFLPAGYPQDPYGGYDDLGLAPLKDVPPVACTPAARICRATALPLGELSLEIEGDVATTVVVRRFAYPFWQIDPALPLVATDPLRLVSFVASAGRHAYRLRHERPWAEKAGWAISAAALVLCLLGAGLARRFGLLRS